MKARDSKMDGFDLKIARLRAGQKQWDVAAKIGVSQSRLSLIELGRVTARPNELSKLREVLGIISE